MSNTHTQSFKELLADHGPAPIVPKIGDTISGSVLHIGRNEVRVDIHGLAVGVIRGTELEDASRESSNLSVGDSVEATVVDLENENGEIELSFRFAGAKKAWDALRVLQEKGDVLSVPIAEANKGGLIVYVNNLRCFLPVSQLMPEHYPRVTGGDKSRILEKLRSYVGKPFQVKVLDVNPDEEKVIVSEKAAGEERQRTVIDTLKAGDIVEGKITALTDFGAFVAFAPNIEGLVHISEISWSRVDHPRDVLTVGQTVKAKVLNTDGTKVYLSIKGLSDDPWSTVEGRYTVGQVVKGKITKVNPFGLFVELDPEIHGLAHSSELSNKPVADANQIAKPGDTIDFRIISLDAKAHRLGLSIKALTETPVQKKDEQKTEGTTEEQSEAATASKTEQASEETSGTATTPDTAATSETDVKA